MVYTKHYKESRIIDATPEQVFALVDDHQKFSSHMSKSTWQMGGGKMTVELDERKGQGIDSHIKLSGKVLGQRLFLDEIVTEYNPPTRKAWKTVGDLRLIVIGHYQMMIDIVPIDHRTKMIVAIDYNLPTKWKWLGTLFGQAYARWCVKQMLSTTAAAFKKRG